MLSHGVSSDISLKLVSFFNRAPTRLAALSRLRGGFRWGPPRHCVTVTVSQLLGPNAVGVHAACGNIPGIDTGDREVADVLVLMPVRVWFARGFVSVGVHGADVTRRCLRSTP